ncbi:general substrate transporter [Auriculariales sp. MPI-PUGE-AT-0066]|nr:general substrate transporter [Auriculariales sp. MPI-PUGE-AT-0066]
MVVTVASQQTGEADPIISRLAAEDKIPWYRKPNLRALYLLLLPTAMGIEITSGFDSQMINALQIVPAWQNYFDHPKAEWKGFIGASYALGAILSLPLVPIVNERLGRRWSIFLGSWVMVIGAIVQFTAKNVAHYIVARAVLGFGIPTCIVAASALIGELGYPKERPVLTSLFNVSYFIGSIVAASICLRTNTIQSDWSWRIPSVLQACPSLVQIFLVFLLPESPRWLISKGRKAEAEAILYKYHSEGPGGHDFVRAELAQIETTIAIELEASKRSWGDLVRTVGKRRRLAVTAFLGLATQWSGNTLISYYLGDILKMIGKPDSLFQQRLNLGLSAWNGVAALLAALLVTKFKRRTMYLACTISLLCVYISWTISAERSVAGKAHGGNNSANIAVIFFIFAYAPCYNIGYNALTYTYLVELWPFAERSRGIAIFQLFGRLSSFFTIFVNPIGMDNIGWKYLISYCVFLAFEIVFVYFFFVETFGRTLEELTFLFEDKALAQQAVDAVEKVVHHHEIGNASPDEKSSHDLKSEHIETRV